MAETGRRRKPRPLLILDSGAVFQCRSVVSKLKVAVAGQLGQVVDQGLRPMTRPVGPEA